ncbi:MAG: aspartate kinase, partial [Spirochaetes bacterium]|nr:aspartate kinase [Spirochaetota bacterium]
MENKIIVNKFGGGIMIPEHINFAQEHIKEQLSNGCQPVVVVSALKGITDDLVSFLASKSSVDPFIAKVREKHLAMMKEVGIKETPEFTEILQDLKDDLIVVIRFGALDIIQDKILSYGERLSCLFFSLFLQANGIEAKAIRAEDIPVVTDNVRLNANIDYQEAKKNVEKALGDISFVPVISGFTGKDSEGNITTLGRGGTDTTACFVGAALKADKVILWKDTEGVLSADPRIVPQAITVPYISYKEAKESGKIIHSKAIQYIEGHQVNMEI